MTFGEAIQRKGNDKWIITMEELKLMQHNDNWELINLLEEFKAIACIRPKKKKKEILKVKLSLQGKTCC